MRVKFFLIFMLFSSVIFVGFSQNAKNNVERGFSSGNAALVSKVMSERVFCVFSKTNKSLPKDDAQKQLEAFFNEIKPKGFSGIHDSTQGGFRYIIGKLSTSSGEYRVHLLLDTSSNNEEITQIRIESL